MLGQNGGRMDVQPQVIRLADRDPRPSDSDLAPGSRLAIIVAHAECLARDAGARNLCQPTSGQFVRRVLAARSSRRRFFDADLFADPAWDILLELYALECEQRRTSISKLCIAAGVPGTTALRWIEKLHSDGMIVREADLHDARRVWVSISTKAFRAMSSYLQELSSESMPL